MLCVFLAPMLGLCFCFWLKQVAGKVVGVILAVLGVCAWGMLIGEQTEWWVMSSLPNCFWLFWEGFLLREWKQRK